MNRKQSSLVLTGLLALALAGCSSTRSGSGDEMAVGATAGGTSTSGTASAPAGGAAATAATEAPMAMPAQTPATPGPATMQGMPANAVVVSIETVPRQGAATGAVGGSGTAGTSGSSMGDENKQFRITLRMDDGATRVVTQDKPPTFRNGDRVNMMDGVISR